MTSVEIIINKRKDRERRKKRRSGVIRPKQSADTFSRRSKPTTGIEFYDLGSFAAGGTKHGSWHRMYADWDGAGWVFTEKPVTPSEWADYVEPYLSASLATLEETYKRLDQSTAHNYGLYLLGNEKPYKVGLVAGDSSILTPDLVADRWNDGKLTVDAADLENVIINSAGAFNSAWIGGMFGDKVTSIPSSSSPAVSGFKLSSGAKVFLTPAPMFFHMSTTYPSFEGHIYPDWKILDRHEFLSIEYPSGRKAFEYSEEDGNSFGADVSQDVVLDYRSGIGGFYDGANFVDGEGPDPYTTNMFPFSGLWENISASMVNYYPADSSGFYLVTIIAQNGGLYYVWAADRLSRNYFSIEKSLNFPSI